MEISFGLILVAYVVLVFAHLTSTGFLLMVTALLQNRRIETQIIRVEDLLNESEIEYPEVKKPEVKH